MRYRPMPTHEVALLCGVSPQTVIRWRNHGHLKLAPGLGRQTVGAGASGYVGGIELRWSASAVEEAVNWSKTPRPNGVNRRFMKAAGA